MPNCPPRSVEERVGDRWEYVVGKALKDWVTAVMAERHLTRADARLVVLDEIRAKSVPRMSLWNRLFGRKGESNERTTS